MQGVSLQQISSSFPGVFAPWGQYSRTVRGDRIEGIVGPVGTSGKSRRAHEKKQGACAGSQTHHASRGELLLRMPEAITTLCDHFPTHSGYAFARDRAGPLWVSLSSA